MQRKITGDTATIPHLCVTPLNAYRMMVQVSDNGRDWRGLGDISATEERDAYGADGKYRPRVFTDYVKATDRFFANLDAANLPYVRCRHQDCGSNYTG